MCKIPGQKSDTAWPVGQSEFHNNSDVGIICYWCSRELGQTLTIHTHIMQSNLYVLIYSLAVIVDLRNMQNNKFTRPYCYTTTASLLYVRRAQLEQLLSVCAVGMSTEFKPECRRRVVLLHLKIKINFGVTVFCVSVTTNIAFRVISCLYHDILFFNLERIYPDWYGWFGWNSLWLRLDYMTTSRSILWMKSFILFRIRGRDHGILS